MEDLQKIKDDNLVDSHIERNHTVFWQIHQNRDLQYWLIKLCTNISEEKTAYSETNDFPLM